MLVNVARSAEEANVQAGVTPPGDEEEEREPTLEEELKPSSNLQPGLLKYARRLRLALVGAGRGAGFFVSGVAWCPKLVGDGMSLRKVESEGAELTAKPAVVKKYANRRLYNTATSSYVTLDELSQMVRKGDDFVVYDAKTGEDITRSVLTQIILEEDGKVAISCRSASCASSSVITITACRRSCRAISSSAWRTSRAIRSRSAATSSRRSAASSR